MHKGLTDPPTLAPLLLPNEWECAPASHLTEFDKLFEKYVQVLTASRQVCYKSWWGCVGKDPDAQGSGSEKRIYLEQVKISKTQAGVRITESQIEGRSKDTVSEYTEQGQSQEVRNTLNM